MNVVPVIPVWYEDLKALGAPDSNTGGAVVELKKEATQKLKEHIGWLTHEHGPSMFAKDYYRYFVIQWYALRYEEPERLRFRR